MKAKYWERVDTAKSKLVKCMLCPHVCIISEGKTGICNVRENIDGELFSLSYGKPVALAIDPIEKKPLYHFLPGSNSFSFGTVGCNLSCDHCQNWDISKGLPKNVPAMDLNPERVVQLALEKGCKSISYTYNEPTVFFEFVIDCAKIAHKYKLKNVLVTNGFINPEPASEFAKYIDAANVDLKSWNSEFYKGVCKAKLTPVLETLKLYKKKGLHIEVTNLIIDSYNDNFSEIEDMCKWIQTNLGDGVPLHFSRAFPMYKMQKIIPTPVETLIKARDIARKYLEYVYIGNIELDGSGNTYCPECGALLISRKYYNIINNIKLGGKCSCGHKIEGIF